jgi:hypothetical protein
MKLITGGLINQAFSWRERLQKALLTVLDKYFLLTKGT